MNARTYCLAGLVLCGILSVTDLALTRALIQGSAGAVYEGNPLAALWLARFGWWGLVLFKAVSLIPFAGAVFVLARLRPRAGAWVVTLAFLALTLVNSYSLGLMSLLHREIDACEAVIEVPTTPRPVPWNPRFLAHTERKP